MSADGEMPGQALAARASIDEIVAHRNHCLELYAQAWQVVRDAGGAAALAGGGHSSLPELTNRNRDFRSDTLERFIGDVRKPLDKAIWLHLLRVTQMATLMDKQAKDEFSRQLDLDPPEVTADACREVFEQMRGDSAMIFQRGIANVFSKLDRRFRSHDGFKIGSRVILTYFAGADGYIHHNGTSDTLADIERTFLVLDGKKADEERVDVLSAVRAARQAHDGSRFGAAAYTAQSDYFKVQVYKNGNAHLWFSRDDLVEQVNLLLATYYGENLGAGPDAADVRHEPNRAPTRNFSLFETPAAVVAKVLEAARLHGTKRVLEPSAGNGRIAHAAVGPGRDVVCVEIQPNLAAGLATSGAFAQVIPRDFFDETPAALGLFDRILMNPPFDMGRDVDHVMHALQFLEPGGILVSVMSASAEWRESARHNQLRAEMERRGGHWRDLPEGSFKESGTMVNTVLCVIGRKDRW